MLVELFHDLMELNRVCTKDAKQLSVGVDFLATALRLGDVGAHGHLLLVGSARRVAEGVLVTFLQAVALDVLPEGADDF